MTPVHNNCSGQHAAMLGLAVIHGWPVDSYLDPSHPLQERMLGGDGSATTGLPRERDRDHARRMWDGGFRGPSAKHGSFFRPAWLEVLRGRRVRPECWRLWLAHPFMVGGTDRFCTALLDATHGGD